MTRKLVKRLNREAQRRRHGLSKVKVFTQSTNSLRVLQEGGKND
jgi:hypothetical protein